MHSSHDNNSASINEYQMHSGLHGGGGKIGGRCNTPSLQQQQQQQHSQQQHSIIYSSQGQHGINRRKSSINYQNHLQSQQSQLQLIHAAVSTSPCDSQLDSTAERLSSHEILMPPLQHQHQYYNNTPKLSVAEQYDESPVCCLPPPSPAPNSDRFIMGIVTTTTTPPPPATSGNNASNSNNSCTQQFISHLTSSNSTTSMCSNATSNQGSHSNSNNTMQLQLHNNINLSHVYLSDASTGGCIQQQQQRAISPNPPRFRLSEQRYREVTPTKNIVDQSNNSSSSNNNSSTSTARYANASNSSAASSSHFLPHSQLVASDTYTYLSSTVHTPIKRYVPTPPPPLTTNNEFFGCENGASVESSGKLCTAGNSGHLTPQHVHTLPLPLRMRMKCCVANEQSTTLQQQKQQYPQQQPQILLQQPKPVLIDNYSTFQTSKDLNHLSCTDPASSSFSSTHHSHAQHFLNNSKNNKCYNSGVNIQTNNNNINIKDFPPKDASSLSSSPFNSTISASSSSSAAAASSSASPVIVATCLHCNTARRTAGVHQTTQTTGPISPIPISAANQVFQGNINCSSAISTMSQGTSGTSVGSLSTNSPTNGVESTSSLLTKTTVVNNLPVTTTTTTQLDQVQRSTKVETTSSSSSSSNNCSPQQQQPQQQQLHLQLQQLTTVPAQHQQQQQQQHYSRKKSLSQYIRQEVARFFGLDPTVEAAERELWHYRQRRLALRRFGPLRVENDMYDPTTPRNYNYSTDHNLAQLHQQRHHTAAERPDILPAHDATRADSPLSSKNHRHYPHSDFRAGEFVARKETVAKMAIQCITYIIQALHKRQPRQQRQWSRSFAPAHVNMNANDGAESPNDFIEDEEEVFFDSPGTGTGTAADNQAAIGSTSNATISPLSNSGVGVACAFRTQSNTNNANKITERHAAPSQAITHHRHSYLGDRIPGWRTSAATADMQAHEHDQQQQQHFMQQQQQQSLQQGQQQQLQTQQIGGRGCRISAHLLDGVLENSRRPLPRRIKLYAVNDLDDRTDHRPFFTYWINTVQVLVLFLSLICYGIGPIGIGSEQRTGQVLVTSLSLQTVQHNEQRNIWVGPRSADLVHMGAKFATCMRRDTKIIDVLLKTRRQERETACCIRNDDSGCVQSSQADCSVRGLFPTKSISTWKKWSPGESGPGGRISGSVCGLDPKYCDAPASIAPYEWPDDITKWPICRKTNSFSQRFRYKDHTAEHMVCEVIGHPCCTGIYGECRITTREYCDFINGYFHEEASLCSQISCLSNVCGMFPFVSVEVPDQFYRLFTSLCMHAGILHLAISIIFQHIYLADLERLIGPIRTAVVYIGSGLAGNLTSVLLSPYKPEVGPLASLSGVIASLVILLLVTHWNHLRKPHIALFKLLFIGALLFGLGTLPWQLNFAGLLAGIICGTFLTIALVPFVSLNKYARKTKIRLIWSCVIFHVFVFSGMLVIFYVFPTELTNLNFGEAINNYFNPNFGTIGGGGSSGGPNIITGSGGDVLSSRNHLLMDGHFPASKFQYHHHSNDIITNAVMAEISGDDNNNNNNMLPNGK